MESYCKLALKPLTLNLQLEATVAQMVEQVIRNDQVVGSIPISGSNNLR